MNNFDQYVLIEYQRWLIHGNVSNTLLAYKKCKLVRVDTEKPGVGWREL